jgi:hypothetical protein
VARLARFLSVAATAASPPLAAHIQKDAPPPPPHTSLTTKPSRLQRRLGPPARFFTTRESFSHARDHIFWYADATDPFFSPPPTLSSINPRESLTTHERPCLLTRHTCPVTRPDPRGAFCGRLKGGPTGCRCAGGGAMIRLIRARGAALCCSANAPYPNDRRAPAQPAARPSKEAIGVITHHIPLQLGRSTGPKRQCGRRGQERATGRLLPARAHGAAWLLSGARTVRRLRARKNRRRASLWPLSRRPKPCVLTAPSSPSPLPSHT